jgi:hypothetical protein
MPIKLLFNYNPTTERHSMLIAISIIFLTMNQSLSKRVELYAKVADGLFDIAKSIKL